MSQLAAQSNGGFVVGSGPTKAFKIEDFNN